MKWLCKWCEKVVDMNDETAENSIELHMDSCAGMRKEFYSAINRRRSAAGHKSMSPEARKARSKKAVAARELKRKMKNGGVLKIMFPLIIALVALIIALLCFV